MTCEDERIQSILNRLPSWWEKGEDSYTYKVVSAFADEMCDFYGEAENVHLEIFVETSTGERLDQLGRIFELTRRVGETDDAFRIRIMAYWPGFSGGGTIPAIKSTINRMTGIPETDINVIEKAPPDITFVTDILLDSPEDLLLRETIRDVVWDIKAAGVYPFFVWTIGGDLTAEYLNVTDSVDINYITTHGWFIYEASLIDGDKLIW